MNINVIDEDKLMSQIGLHFKLGANKPQEIKFISLFILIGQELKELMFKRIYNAKSSCESPKTNFSAV